MSHFQFSIQALSLNETNFKLTSRSFDLNIDNSKLLMNSNNSINPIEFLLSDYARCMGTMGHIVARELEIDLAQLEIKVYGNLNPERLLKNSYDSLKKEYDINVEFSTESEAADEVWEVWLEALIERLLLHQKLQYLIPKQVSLQTAKQYMIAG